MRMRVASTVVCRLCPLSAVAEVLNIIPVHHYSARTQVDRKAPTLRCCLPVVICTRAGARAVSMTMSRYSCSASGSAVITALSRSSLTNPYYVLRSSKSLSPHDPSVTACNHTPHIRDRPHHSSSLSCGLWYRAVGTWQGSLKRSMV